MAEEQQNKKKWQQDAEKEPREVPEDIMQHHHGENDSAGRKCKT